MNNSNAQNYDLDFYDVQTLLAQLDSLTDTLESEVDRVDCFRQMLSLENAIPRERQNTFLDFINRLKYLLQLQHQELKRADDMIEDFVKVTASLKGIVKVCQNDIITASKHISLLVNGEE